MNLASQPKIEQRLLELKKSKFRRGIQLRQKERDYFARLALNKLEDHAERFVRDRIAPASPPNDGKQTPWKGHPVFVAQHATATCCRNCMAKWHGIDTGIPLTESDIEFVVALIIRWLQQNAPEASFTQKTEDLPLFRALSD